MTPYFAERLRQPVSGSHRFARRGAAARSTKPATMSPTCSGVTTGRGGVHQLRHRKSDNTAVLAAVSRIGGVAVCPAAEHHAVLHAGRGAVANGVIVRGRSVSPGLMWTRSLICSPRRCAAPGAMSAVVSVMAVNNEGRHRVRSRCRCRRRRASSDAPRALLHTDAVQAPCWLDLRALAPARRRDCALSAHKFGGPKGVGVLVDSWRPTHRPASPRSPVAVKSASGAAAPTTSPGSSPSATRSAVDTDTRRRATEIRSARRSSEDRLVGWAAHRATRRRDRDDPTCRRRVRSQNKVAGSAHVCIGGIEIGGTAVPPRRGRRLRQRRPRPVARAVRWSPRTSSPRWASTASSPSARSGSASGTHQPRPTSTAGSRRSRPQ